jgi:hypothetical protein
MSFPASYYLNYDSYSFQEEILPRLVWVSDSDKTYLATFMPDKLRDDGTVDVDGRMFRWLPVTK